MITIEEKLKIFKKIVYDKVDREYHVILNNLDKEFTNNIDSMKKEYEEEANIIWRDSQRDIEREKTRIISKAKIEEKKVLRDMEKRIFDETLDELIMQGKEYIQTREYEKKLFGDLKDVASQATSDEIEFFSIEDDLKKHREAIEQLFKDKIISFIIDEELIGGFIVKEPLRGVRYDMSILGRIMASRETIGNMLFKSLH